MGRPRKPESEKLRQVMTMLPPPLVERLERIAKAHDLKVSAVVRRILERRIDIAAPLDN